MKTFVRLLAVVALSWPAAGQAAFFEDVPDDHPYVEEVDFLFSQRIATGYPDRTFHPDVSINRVEFVKIVISALFASEEIDSCVEDLTGVDENIEEFSDLFPSTDPLPTFQRFRFRDVDYDAWYGNALCTAQIEGIVSGYDDGTFRPEQRVNFAEAATILARAFEVMKTHRHLKVDRIWYRPFVQDLSDIRAIPASIGGFDHYLTRSEMAVMIHRLVTFTETKAMSPKPYLTYEEIARGGDWPEHRDERLGFVLHYAAEWPEPALIERGFFDGGIPTETSDWRLYIGPKLACSGFGECLERKFMLDGYNLNLADKALAELEEFERAEVLSDGIVNGARAIVFDEPGICVQRSALIFGKKYLYRLQAFCGGDIPAQARMLQRLVSRFEVIDCGRTPEQCALSSRERQRESVRDDGAPKRMQEQLEPYRQ